MHGKHIENTVRQLAPGRRTTAAFMGWRPDLPDIRDFSYRASNPDQHSPLSLTRLPSKGMDPRIVKQPVFDQGQRGSCTGQSTAVLHAIERGVTPRSALFVYWHARDLIGEVEEDNGAYIRDAIKITNVEGVPRDDLWPDDDLHLFPPPSPKAESDAERRKIFNYYRLESRQDYRACLAASHCFVIGFTVYENFWEAGYNGGVASMPQGRPDGGHAVIVYGFDDNFPDSVWGRYLIARGVTPPASVYLVRNSWGRDWGNEGDFAIDSRFFDDPNLADDAWTIRRK